MAKRNPRAGHPGAVAEPIEEEDLKDNKPFDQGRIDEATRTLDEGPHLLVCKPPRSGFTTSAILSCVQREKKLLIIEPTNRLIDETVRRAGGQDLAVIESNKFCPRLQEMAQLDPLLEELPSVLPDCKSCKYENCPLATIVEDLQAHLIAAVTFSKLLTLMVSGSERAKKILEELKNFDIVLFDECENLVYPQSSKISADSDVKVPSEFRHLDNLVTKWKEVLTQNAALIEKLSEGDRGGKNLSSVVEIERPVDFKELVLLWQELQTLCIKRSEYGASEAIIRDLNSLIGVLSSPRVSIAFVGGDPGGVVVTGLEGRSQIGRVMLEIVEGTGTQAVLTSATPSEPCDNWFSNKMLNTAYGDDEEPIGGKDRFREVIFKDLNETNKKFTIYPDSWSLRHFKENLSRIVDRISEILEIEGEAYILAPNRAKAAVIRNELKQRGQDVEIDFYRSVATAGVENSHRVGIAIGLAEVPANSYDHLIGDGDEEERWIESRKLREASVHAASYQAWSRVKDPQGAENSKLYCIGARGWQASDCVKWGTGRRLVARQIMEYEIDRQIKKSIRFDVELDELIEPPNVERERMRKGKQRAADLIIGTDQYIEHENEWLIENRHQAGEFRQLERENFAPVAGLGNGAWLENIPPNIIGNGFFLYRRNVARISLSKYSELFTSSVAGSLSVSSAQLSKEPLSHTDFRKISSDLLFGFFLNRRDAYGKQHLYSGRYVTDKKGKTKWKEPHWGYLSIVRAVIHDPIHGDDRWTPDFHIPMVKHLQGEITVGSYQASSPEDPQTNWLCYDLDRHEATDPDPKPFLGALIKTLRGLSIPFLLEASGSPDSYHLWVLIQPAVTLFTAYKFAHLIADEAGVSGIEIFPKQNSLYGGKGFGNLVKLPLGINRKNKKWSTFLDPDTFEPTFPLTFGTVQLKNIKPQVHRPVSVKNLVAEGLPQCLARALNTPLEGGAGHLCRLAIALSGIHSGMSVEDTAYLFRNQEDFDLDISMKYVDGLSGYQHNFGCENLRTGEISEITRRFCDPDCPKYRLHWLPEDVENAKAEGWTDWYPGAADGRNRRNPAVA